MKKEDCIFCKIANGEIPSKTLYEDGDFRVILDLGPDTRGHAKKMATKMTEKLHCDGLNIVQNNGEAAGQTVRHFHMHLIPRYENDGQHILWNPGESTPEELEELRRKGFLPKTRSKRISGKPLTPYERTRAQVAATGNRWAMENFIATHS